MSEPQKKSLEHVLKQISENGISLDRAQLRKDVCRQFPDYRLWIREFIVNAFDAGAQNCHITGTAEGDLQTITVQDDGRGMNREQIEGFMMKFRSSKDDPGRAVGKFGIGSFSVAAIPNQCGFYVVTSTGKETWRFFTGNLLEGHPIVVQRLHDVRPRGTTFDISYRFSEQNVAETLNTLSELACKYLYHLPINVFFHTTSEPEFPEMQVPQWISGNWLQEADEYLPKRYCFQLPNGTFDAVLAVGQTRQALFQKRVLIAENSEDFDLLSQHTTRLGSCLKGLVVRIDSDAFEMPLGRHCLSNTHKLDALIEHLYSSLIPSYVSEVVADYQNAAGGVPAKHIAQMEEFLCSYLWQSAGGPSSSNQARLFRTHDGHRLSFTDLESAVVHGSSIYLEDRSSNGLDYSVFEGPVLSEKQPGDGILLIKALFKDAVVNLWLNDIVQEAPASKRKALTEREKKFAQGLALHPEAIGKLRTGRVKVPASYSRLSKSLKDQLQLHARDAIRDLKNMIWKVSHLVQRDGVTPCMTVLYLCKDNKVTLNVNHDGIRKLVALSETAPQIAAHFAIALCLSTTGKNSILPHLSAEDRESLLNLDAILRCGEPIRRTPEAPLDDVPPKTTNDSLDDFNLNSTMDDLPF